MEHCGTFGVMSKDVCVCVIILDIKMSRMVFPRLLMILFCSSLLFLSLVFAQVDNFPARKRPELEHGLSISPLDSSSSAPVDSAPSGVHQLYGDVKVVINLDDVALEISRNEPFVLRGLVTQWRGYEKFSLDYFVEEFGESTAMTQQNNYPTVKLDADNSDRPLMELRKIVVSEGPREYDSPPMYGALTLNLKQRNKIWRDIYLPASLQDSEFLECLGSERLVERFLGSFFWSQVFVGAPGTGMEMHSDMIRTHVWTAQLSGEKQAVFCPPGGKPFDAFSTNVPKVSEICLWTALQPGELLFWPSNWLHQTFNSRGPSVAVSGMAIPEGALSKQFERTLSQHPHTGNALRKHVARCLKRGR